MTIFFLQNNHLITTTLKADLWSAQLSSDNSDPSPSQSDMYFQVTSILRIKKIGNSGEARVMLKEGDQCVIHLLINAGYWYSGSGK